MLKNPLIPACLYYYLYLTKKITTHHLIQKINYTKKLKVIYEINKKLYMQTL